MPIFALLPSLAGILFLLLYLRWQRSIFTRRERAVAMFLERTGYRVHGCEHLPLAEQAREVMSPRWIDGALQVCTPPYTRAQGGDRLTYFHAPAPGGETWGAPFGCAGWVLRLREPLRVRWSLVPQAGFLAEPATWRPGSPRVDVAHLDLAVDAYASDAAALRAILADPELVDALERCAHLELHVLGDVVVLLDPKLRTLAAASGGAVANIAVMWDPEHMMDLAAMGHEHVADLLGDVVAATRRVA